MEHDDDAPIYSVEAWAFRLPFRPLALFGPMVSTRFVHTWIAFCKDGVPIFTMDAGAKGVSEDDDFKHNPLVFFPVYRFHIRQHDQAESVKRSESPFFAESIQLHRCRDAQEFEDLLSCAREEAQRVNGKGLHYIALRRNCHAASRVLSHAMGLERAWCDANFSDDIVLPARHRPLDDVTLAGGPAEA